MAKVKLTVTDSKCRSGYCKSGDGPDEGRVSIHGEIVEE